MDPDDPTSEVTLSTSGPRLRSRKIRVEVVQGPDRGVVADLPGPEARIGSGKDCDLTLTDPTVSRLHLMLRVEDVRIRVIDQGSRNGTTVDGTQVRDAYARPDSSIVLGGSTLRLKMLATSVELPVSSSDRFGRLLGASLAMRRMFAILERVSPTDVTLLIEGETGTGKELVARGVHEASARAKGPFVVFDCSAVSATLAESELFGHVRGAFTGAESDRPGAFEQADKGTLFLDEIGELPLPLQPKLLRALQEREVRRLGENKTKRVDVRVLAATNRSLSQAVDHGLFREDLYYRLAVICIRLPPLRERSEDIALLARHFERELAPASQAAEPLSEKLMNDFAAQSWPGNVRELRNAVARVLSLGATTEASSGDSPAPAPPAHEVDLSVPLLIGRRRVADAYEKAYVEQALKETGGNIRRAAVLAGVGRKFFQQAMKRCGLPGGASRGKRSGPRARARMRASIARIARRRSKA